MAGLGEQKFFELENVQTVVHLIGGKEAPRALPASWYDQGRPMDVPDWEYLLSEQVRQNSRLYYQLAFRIVRDDAAAQDVCQHAFAQAWAHRHRIDPSGKTLGAWIAATVRRECLQRVRRLKIERRALAEHVATRPEVSDDPRETAELRDLVAAALARVPEPARSMLKLKFFDGMSPKEIGTLYKCSESDLWRQMHKVLQMLRGCLSDQAPPPPPPPDSSPRPQGRDDDQ